jgi:hypothetical protein
MTVLPDTVVVARYAEAKAMYMDVAYVIPPVVKVGGAPLRAGSR